MQASEGRTHYAHSHCVDSQTSNSEPEQKDRAIVFDLFQMFCTGHKLRESACQAEGFRTYVFADLQYRICTGGSRSPYAPWQEFVDDQRGVLPVEPGGNPPLHIRVLCRWQRSVIVIVLSLERDVDLLSRCFCIDETPSELCSRCQSCMAPAFRNVGGVQAANGEF